MHGIIFSFEEQWNCTSHVNSTKFSVENPGHVHVFSSSHSSNSVYKSPVVQSIHRRDNAVFPTSRGAQLSLDLPRSPPWKIKIVMACLQTILRDESQTIGNSPLCSSGPTLNSTNQPDLPEVFALGDRVEWGMWLKHRKIDHLLVHHFRTRNVVQTPFFSGFLHMMPITRGIRVLGRYPEQTPRLMRKKIVTQKQGACLSLTPQVFSTALSRKIRKVKKKLTG